MAHSWMISSDSHIVERPDLFTSRIDRAFADRAPRVVQADGVDWWIVGDEPQVPALNPSRAGDRFASEDSRPRRVRFDRDVRPGGYLPDEWLKDNEQDGVYGGVLFPSMSLVFYGIEDSALLTAVCRAYTDWAIEFASADPNRLKAIAMINLDDIPAAVRELERARRAGAAGALIPVAPLEDHPYDSPEYDPFWAAAQDLDMPLNMHVATNRPHGQWTLIYKFSQHISAPDYWVRIALADMILGGVFDRFPGLRVGSVEHEGGWAAYFVERMDHLYTESLDFAPDRPAFRNAAVPSDFFRQNVFISFAEDPVAVRNREYIGLGNLMWGNDYPHGESTFPRSREIVAQHFAGIPIEQLRQLTLGNVASLYHFEVPAEEVA